MNPNNPNITVFVDVSRHPMFHVGGHVTGSTSSLKLTAQSCLVLETGTLPVATSGQSLLPLTLLSPPTLDLEQGSCDHSF